MIKNYLKITYRVLIQNPGFSIINIIGLTAGLASFILIYLWVVDELSYDRYHEKVDRIYALAQDQFYNGEPFSVYAMPTPLKPMLDESIAQIEKSTRIANRNMIFKRDDEIFNEPINLVDPEFFDIFSIPVDRKLGNITLGEKYTAIISKKIANKYFHDSEALGQSIQVRTPKGVFELKITGILGDIPENSLFHRDIFVNFNFLKEFDDNMEGWGNTLQMYILAHKDIQQSELDGAIEKLLHEPQNTDAVLYTHPMKDRHLYKLHFKSGGLIDYIIIFSSVALLILVIACINFMNLSTARSARRAKEIGIRKTVGASRAQIIYQFYGEAIVLTFIALYLSVIVVEILRPAFNAITGKNIFLPYSEPGFVLSLLLIGLVTALFAGSYPALFMSGFNPALILKGNVRIGSGASLRKALVIFQFILSTILIIGMLSIDRQLTYIRNKNLGIQRENIIYFAASSMKNAEQLKESIGTVTGVVSSTFSTHIPTRVYSNGGGLSWEGKNPDTDVLISFMGMDEDYLKTFEITMNEGRFFNPDIASDTVNNVIINQAFAEIIPGDTDTDKQLTGYERPYNIIGIINNFHYNELDKEIGPVMMYLTHESNYLFVRYESEDIEQLISEIRSINKNLHPDTPVDIKFLDETIDSQYRAERRMGSLISYFGILALIISGLGLYGLSLFMASRRRKEMGTRKVFGASMKRIIVLMSSEFARLVLIANVIAIPIGWYFMNKWLESFAYHVNFEWWIVILAVFISFLVSLGTVLYQSIKTASTNPADTLKYE